MEVPFSAAMRLVGCPVVETYPERTLEEKQVEMLIQKQFLLNPFWL